jgi:hypothetical protein
LWLGGELGINPLLDAYLPQKEKLQRRMPEVITTTMRHTAWCVIFQGNYPRMSEMEEQFGERGKIHRVSGSSNTNDTTSDIGKSVYDMLKEKTRGKGCESSSKLDQHEARTIIWR